MIDFEPMDNHNIHVEKKKKQRQPKWEETDTVYLELDIPKEIVGIACV